MKTVLSPESPVPSPGVAAPVETVKVRNLGGRIYAAGAVRAHGDVFEYPKNQLQGLGRYELVKDPATLNSQPSTGAA